MECFVGCFPPCSMMAAYGSGVFSQGSEDKSKLVDLLVVAKDVSEWHEKNLCLNESHYPRWMRNAARARWFQTKGGARMTFFPYVNLGGFRCKYGVIGEADLIRDLANWDTLYCAGRLHKPVRLLHAPTPSSELDTALKTNLTFAVSAAMVLLASSGRVVASEGDVYTQISRLSYDGDIRMLFAENPRKVENIVSNNLAAFNSLYRTRLDNMLDQGVLHWGKPIQMSGKQILPLRLASLAPNELKEELARTVRLSSAVQTMKNAISAGFGKSARYALRKIGKRFS